MDEEFKEWLDTVRYEFGKPMIVSSGYRCPKHPLEMKKAKPGSHNTGKAVDIKVRGEDALELTAIAYKLGCRRVGWKQKGNTRFVHLDRCEEDKPKSVWTY